MSISFFDSLIEGTSAIADALFGKKYEVSWNGQTCTLTAILSAHPVVTENYGSIGESTHSHNFEINAADLKFGGIVTEPQVGMEFRETLADGSVDVYEVRPRDKLRCFDQLDAEDTRLIVFTNFFQNEPA